MKILFIKPYSKHDYIYPGIRHAGYDIEPPYYWRGLFLRLIWGIWIKLRLPESLWFNKRVALKKYDMLVVFDVLVTLHFLEYLRAQHPQARILLFYNNPVGKANHLHPGQVPDHLAETWSYNKGDCEIFGLKHNPHSLYFSELFVEKKEAVYDVFFVGRDKYNRAEKLLSLEQELKKEGIRTYFHITASRQYQRFQKRFYKPLIEYDEVRRYIAKSRAILNINIKGQSGRTIRDIESAFNEVKLITDNPNIIHEDIYCESNVFILTEESDLSTVKAFLDKPFTPIKPEILEGHLFPAWLNKMISG